jgi:3'-phosphoadenosine 5'-phosphosulfate (PAPS) 3'-phosphatase
MASSRSKIFGIGLSKTGTTSLANALQILGYKTKDNMGVVMYAPGDLSSVDLDVVEAFEAITDTPIPSFYRELDARFSGSKFILTVRDSDGWMKSCKKQFTQRFAKVQTDAHKRLFADLYGTDVFDEQRFASGYERFVDGVRDYFKNRPRDLLIINIAAGEGWGEVCRFLERPVPDIPFPKANVTQVRWMGINEVIAVATQAGLELMQRYDSERPVGFNGDHRQRTQLHGAKKLFERAVQTVLGEDGVQAATRAAHKAIVRGLLKLNPEIPVLSRAGDLAPHTVRREWNHLWLVDPLDGERAFASGIGQFSINIALIEDGRPIYGVVYAPATDTIYYGMVGKGAYRRAHGGEPVRLAPSGDPNPPATAAAGTREPTTATGRGSMASSYALAMCVLSEGTANTRSTFQPSLEWQTAAAHAILNCAGMRVCESESGRELGYNKQDLSNSVVKIESTTAVHA